MQVNETDGVGPSTYTPSATTMRPSGDKEQNERVPDNEARENDRRDNLRISEGVNIDIMA